MPNAMVKDVTPPPPEKTTFGMDEAINALLTPNMPTPEISPSEEEHAEAPEPQAEGAGRRPAEEAMPEAEFEEATLEDAIQGAVDTGETEQLEEIVESEPSTPNRVYAIDIGDGQTIQVTEDELIKGYRRQSDYTRKFQEVAEQRRSLENELSQASQTRQQYLDTIAQVQAHIESQMPAYPPESLAEADRDEYLLQAEQARAARERLHQLEQERQRVWQEQVQYEKQQFTEQLAEEQKRVLERIPEWKDENVRKQESLDIRDYMLASGYTEEQISNIYDSRALAQIRKAWLYDKMVSNGALKAKEVKRKPTVVSGSRAARAPSTATQEKSSSRLVKQASERFAKAASAENSTTQDAMYAAADLLLAQRRAR